MRRYAMFLPLFLALAPLQAQGISTAQLRRFGPTLPSECHFETGDMFTQFLPGVVTVWACTAENMWTQLTGGSSSLPSGMITMITSGTCPSGFTQAADLNGVTLVGTLAANGDVGTTGGANSITPAGTNTAPTLTMGSYTPSGSNGSVSFTPAGLISWPVGVPAFTGTPGTVPAEIFTGTAGTVPAETITGSTATENAHTHSVTSNVTNVAGTLTIVTTRATVASSGSFYAPSSIGGTTLASGTTSVGQNKDTLTNNAVTSGVGTAHLHGVGTLSNGTAAFTPAGTNGTAAFTPTGSIAWPAGVPTLTGTSGSVPAQTFTGTPATLTGSVSAPSFTGSSFDNRSAFIKVIFCRAN